MRNVEECEKFKDFTNPLRKKISQNNSQVLWICLLTGKSGIILTRKLGVSTFYLEFYYCK